MTRINQDGTALAKTAANFAPLTPLNFLTRAGRERCLFRLEDAPDIAGAVEHANDEYAAFVPRLVEGQIGGEPGHREHPQAGQA